jgi:hypothetical protein
MWDGVKVIAQSSAFKGVPNTAIGDGVIPTTALWVSYVTPAYAVLASQYSGDAWTTPAMNLGTGAYTAPAVATRDHVPTTVFKASNFAISASRWDSGTGSFPAGTNISGPENTSSYLDVPNVCQDVTGRAVAVWQESVSNTYTLKANHFDGTSWGEPIPIAGVAAMGSTSGGIPLACDMYGNATVAYHTPGFPSFTYAARFEPNNPTTPGWQPAERIGPNDGTSYSSESPGLAVDMTGAVLAVWSANNGGTSAGKLLSNRYDPVLGWGDPDSPKLIHASTEVHRFPTVAMDSATPGGRAAVAWFGITSTTVSASILDDTVNGDWSAAQAVSTPGADWSAPQVAVDGNGFVRVLWGQAGTIFSGEHP